MMVNPSNKIEKFQKYLIPVTVGHAIMLLESVDTVFNVYDDGSKQLLYGGTLAKLLDHAPAFVEYVLGLEAICIVTQDTSAIQTDHDTTVNATIYTNSRSVSKEYREEKAALSIVSPMNDNLTRRRLKKLPDMDTDNVRELQILPMAANDISIAFNVIYRHYNLDSKGVTNIELQESYKIGPARARGIINSLIMVGILIKFDSRSPKKIDYKVTGRFFKQFNELLNNTSRSPQTVYTDEEIKETFPRVMEQWGYCFNNPSNFTESVGNEDKTSRPECGTRYTTTDYDFMIKFVQYLAKNNIKTVGFKDVVMILEVSNSKARDLMKIFTDAGIISKGVFGVTKPRTVNEAVCRRYIEDIPRIKSCANCQGFINDGKINCCIKGTGEDAAKGMRPEPCNHYIYRLGSN